MQKRAARSPGLRFSVIDGVALVIAAAAVTYAANFAWSASPSSSRTLFCSATCSASRAISNWLGRPCSYCWSAERC